MIKILIIWLGSKVVYNLIDYGTILRLEKEVADLGYKIEESKMIKYYEKYFLGNDNNKILFNYLKNFIVRNIPGINVIQIIKQKIKITNKFDDLVIKFQELGFLEEMTELEKYEYKKNPTIIGLVTLDFKTKKLMDKTRSSYYDDNGNYGYVTYTKEKNGDLILLEEYGSLASLSLEEKKEKIKLFNRKTMAEKISFSDKFGESKIFYELEDKYKVTIVDVEGPASSLSLEEQKQIVFNHLKKDFTYAVEVYGDPDDDLRKIDEEIRIANEEPSETISNKKEKLKKLRESLLPQKEEEQKVLILVNKKN